MKICFIPAWYEENTWSEREQKWYLPRKQSEFDDTIKQIQLFHRSKSYEYEIALLSYTPNLRHFLHRQGIYRAPYWSCFDSIQTVTRKKVRPLSFYSFKWPEGIEFKYTSFLVDAYLHGEKYASVDFGEDGNPIQVDLYENGIVTRRNLYDDRGFLSSTIVFSYGRASYHDYLDEEGVWKIREYMSDGHVEINPANDGYNLAEGFTAQRIRYKKDSYSSMTELIREVFKSYVGRCAGSTIFCVAMHDNHIDILKNELVHRSTMISVYSDRYSFSCKDDIQKIVDTVNYIITDSKNNIRKMSELFNLDDAHIIDITPFDSRVDFGNSSQLKVKNIMVPIDGIEDRIFIQLLKILGEYIMEHEDTNVVIFTREPGVNVCQKLEERINRILGIDTNRFIWADGQESDVEDDLDEQQHIKLRFEIAQCVDEMAVSRCIREQRVVLDMRKIPDLYLRIAAVSTGLPQILCTESQYVVDGKNGFLIDELRKVPEKLGYYLDSLANWNEANVYTYELGQQYTTDKLLMRWKEVIDSFELY